MQVPGVPSASYSEEQKNARRPPRRNRRRQSSEAVPAGLIIAGVVGCGVLVLGGVLFVMLRGGDEPAIAEASPLPAPTSASMPESRAEPTRTPKPVERRAVAEYEPPPPTVSVPTPPVVEKPREPEKRPRQKGFDRSSTPSLSEDNSVWESVVDPLPNSLKTEWDPAEKSRARAEGRDDVTLVYAGSGSPYFAVHYGRKEWHIHDVRRRKKIGRGAASVFSKPEHCALSRDGKYFVEANRDGLLVTDVREEKVLGTLPAESRSTPYFIAEDRIAAISSDEVQLWELPSGDPVTSFSIERGMNESCVFTPGGAYLIVPHRRIRDVTLIVYDTGSGEQRCRMDVPEVTSSITNPLVLDVSQDGRLLAGLTGGDEPQIYLWDLETGESLDPIPFRPITMAQGRNARFRSSFSNRDAYKHLAWFPDGEHLMVGRNAVVSRSGDLVFAFPDQGTWCPPAIPAGDRAIMLCDRGAKTRGARALSMDAKEFQEVASALRAGGTANDFDLPQLTLADRSELFRVNPLQENVRWEAVPDPAPAAETSFLSEITIPERKDALSGLRFAGRATGKVALFYDLQSKPGRENQQEVQIDLFSLESGRREDSLRVPYDCSLLSLSAGGQMVALRLALDKERIDIWKIGDSDDESHVCGFRPYEPGEDLVAAQFIGDDHLATLSRRNRLVVWEVPSCKAVFEIEHARGPGASPAGRYLAVRAGNNYVMIEVATGRIAGRLAADMRILAASFHPDGRLFAAVTQSSGQFDTPYATLVCWDMASGRMYSEVPLHYGGNTLHWCGEEHVLVDNSLLVNVTRRVPVWTYGVGDIPGTKEAHHCVNAPDDRHWYLASSARSSREEIKLHALELPRDGEPSGSIPELQEMLALYPGQPLRLQFELPRSVVSEEQDQQIRDHIGQEAERIGLRISDDADCTLVLKFEERQAGTSTYVPNPFGIPSYPRMPSMPGFPSFQPPQNHKDAVKVANRQILCVGRILYQGEPIWEGTRVFGNPSQLSRDKKKSLESQLEALRKNNATKFFLTVQLPKYVYHANTGYGYGTTLLGWDGAVSGGSDPIRPVPGRGYNGGRVRK